MDLRKYIRTTDPNLKEWSPPFSDKSLNYDSISCTGKNIADCVESLLGAFFMSNNLYKTLRWISDLKLVPLKQARLLEVFPDEEIIFEMGPDLDIYQF